MKSRQNDRRQMILNHNVGFTPHAHTVLGCFYLACALLYRFLCLLFASIDFFNICAQLALMLCWHCKCALHHLLWLHLFLFFNNNMYITNDFSLHFCFVTKFVFVFTYSICWFVLSIVPKQHVVGNKEIKRDQGQR